MKLIVVVIQVALVMLSVIIHEVSHGLAALALGDETAKRAGRLTLNPFKHLDPIGSVALPVVMALLGGPVFAYAKPVPYNPRNLKHLKRDEVLVAFAGPASNFIQALIAALAIRAMGSRVVLSPGAYWAVVVLYQYFWVNISLMLFNLIPLPPLDGSSIVSPLLSGAAREKYYQIHNYALPVLLVLLYVLPSLVGVDVIGLYINHVGGWFETLLLGGML